MTIKRDIEGRITFHCDTPNCEATFPTSQRFHNAAALRARQGGWAIGTDDDACPDHHA
jgi:hypothetical protein